MDADLRSIHDARQCARRARAAFEVYRSFDQATVDRIAWAAVEAGYGASERLGKMAVEETGIGRAESKTVKNRFGTRGLWDAVRTMRTCGIVSEDPRTGVTEVADPFGVVAAIIPTTNPTSTALFKAVCCLKSRNAMVASPHPRARRCITEAIRICQEAAEAAGAPKDLLVCMEHVSLEGTQALMTDPQVDLILATGGTALVRAAYSSGKPAFGVGPGNVPAYVDRSADVAWAAQCVVDSQTFDNSTLCSSEAAVVCDAPVADRMLDELRGRHAHVCTADEVRALEGIVIKDGLTNTAIVGLAAARVAEMAGFSVPAETTVLVAPYEGVGKEHPLSREKLCPLIAFYRVDGHEAGCRLCIEVLDQGGRGHTLGLHCDDEDIIRAFALEKPVNRLVVNSPTSLGGVGFTTALFPSMTLGCGSFGGNITSDNVGPQHLLNIKRLARVRPEWRSGQMGTDYGENPPLSTADCSAQSVAVQSPWDAPHRRNPARGPSGSRNPAAVSPAGSPRPAGISTGALPGEHFSKADLERIIRNALARTRPGGGVLD
ncbi:MAG: acetaldehyde dehydrogenase [Deltaproteobacteria bacterium]|nr:acetaldehyde dehydrogenase [Deltaproteobacteria bacterium]